MEINCPYCGNTFTINNMAEKDITCPSCNKTIYADSLSSNTMVGINTGGEEMPEGIRVSLTILEGNDTGKTIQIDKPLFTIGRENADLVLNDSMVSRRHAFIQFYKRRIVIKDAGSTNGIFVGAEMVKETEIKHLDEITIGNTRLLITVFQDNEAKQSDSAGSTILLKEEVSTESTTRIEKPDDMEFKLPYKQKIFLDFIEGVNKDTSYEFFQGKVVIGRTDGDLTIDDPNVSKKHAVIETWSRDTYFIRDLASTNGTFVNGQRVTSTKLRNNDVITVGNTKMRLRVINL